MQYDNVMGMVVGLFVGDALGAPLEFTAPNTGNPVTEMIGGGAHDVDIGEWTDDGAMAMCIMDAYISCGKFSPGAIRLNFKQWARTGLYGTRDYVFDIGNTTRDALSADHTYAGKSTLMASGNGSIMRLAPVVAANHNDLFNATGQAVAVSLMTHGSAATVEYVCGLVRMLMTGQHSSKLLVDGLKQPSESVMGCYASALQSVLCTSSFEEALVHAVNKGGDADTVGAVAGQIAGSMYGIKAIPARWLDKIHNIDSIIEQAEQLYVMGSK